MYLAEENCRVFPVCKHCNQEIKKGGRTIISDYIGSTLTVSHSNGECEGIAGANATEGLKPGDRVGSLPDLFKGLWERLRESELISSERSSN